MSQGLNGRVALITGATGGIGRAIASELYSSGIQLVMTARNQDELYRLRDTIVERFPIKTTRNNPLCVAIDLTAMESEDNLIAQTIDTFGRLDILVNNAAMVDGALFLKTTPTFMQKMMQTNFIAPYYLMQKALPYMLKNKYGRIINITSIAGINGDAGMSAYGASKGALAAATKSIAAEYGRRGITANCVAPGVIETDQTRKIPSERQKQLKEQIPIRRFGTPEEVANIVAYLASERASYINGQQIQINGGLSR